METVAGSTGVQPSGALRVVPVIMSGGSGTRLWPLSTAAKPKQFHSLGSHRTMLQDTILRLLDSRSIEFLPPMVICNRQHRALVEADLQALEITPSAIVLEPVARNTAAAAVIAARMAEALHPGAFVLLAPADHVITDSQAFHEAITRGASVADERIVTFGIAPSSPETGYGYIQRGAAISAGVYDVRRFAEKPDRATAETYLGEGNYDWNGGIFLFSPTVMLEEMRMYRSDILDGATSALDAARREAVVLDLDEALFSKTPSESIDVAVMERTRRAAVAPCAIGWADVGSWNELWRLGAKDDESNVINGTATALDTQGSLVWGDGIRVAVLGMTDVIVVASQGAVMVLPRSRAQEVKRLLAAAQVLEDDVSTKN